MPKEPPPISGFFRVPSRFLRSVQLERDFHDLAALEHYVVTPHMAEAVRRVADGLRTNSGRRAWRITGDYGVGKSSFALVLAHLFQDRSPAAVCRIADAVGWPDEGFDPPPLIPFLITGSREGIIPAVARGIAESLRRRKPARGRMPKALATSIEQAAQVEVEGSVVGVERLLDSVRTYAGRSGVLLIIDELGKLLEHASQRHEREDVFVLQRLAEMAARSGDQPFIVLGMLHQGFLAYAERLPSAVRHEWDKVAGRFDEIVFDQPLTHTAALVAGALNVDPDRLPKTVQDSARDVASATVETGWESGNAAAVPDVAKLYPLHPMLLPVAVRFFARFGQHERSLFGFLLSSEPFAVQAFAARRVAPDAWYGLPEFYDYLRAVFGHRLAGASYRNQWLRIVATIDAAADLGLFEERVIKVVAILNLLDAEDLLATDRTIAAALAPATSRDIDAAIQDVADRGLLFRRGRANAYRLWPSSSVSLESAFETALRTVGPVEHVASAVKPFLDVDPVVARRHYVERGTLRYFEVRYAESGELAKAIQKVTEADGLIVVALSDTDDERENALLAARDTPFNKRDDALVAVVRPLVGLAPDLQDVMCWQWVAENTPELAHDSYASAEVARQLAISRRELNSRLGKIAGLRRGAARDVQWLRAGQPEQVPSRGGLSALVSKICNQLYPDAPRVTNELLNRNSLSSAAAAARMRLIEGLFEAGNQHLLGIDPKKSPPEKSMYLSVIEKGGVHVRNSNGFKVIEPDPNHDPLRLRPALDYLVQQIAGARGARVPVTKLLASLKSRPYGVRDGLVPLLLAIILRTRNHELAIYENGTFLYEFGPSGFLRLTKAPATFEIQHCKVDGVRLEAFSQLAVSLSRVVDARQPDLLEVVQPLCRFAAELPYYTRRATTLSKIAIDVRDTLLSAREPATMLFCDLPQACGLAPFSPEQQSDEGGVDEFVSVFREALGELRKAYPALLSRIVERAGQAAGEQNGAFDRMHLATRAARVSLAAREQRLRTFALRLHDPNLSDDAWAEALASFVVSKPPNRWVSGDEARFCEEIGALAELFQKVEAAAFVAGGEAPAPSAVRLNLTRGDGTDLVRIIEPRSADDSGVQSFLRSVEEMLPQDRHARLDVLTRLVWNELSAPDQRDTVEDEAPPERKWRVDDD